MGKKLIISGAIMILLAGFTFLASVFASFLFSRIIPLQISQPQELMEVSQADLPVSENLNDVSANLDQELTQLQQEVISIRQLRPYETIYRNTLTSEELRERINNDFFADYTDEDLHRDTVVYSLLGVIEPDFDLYDFIVDLYSEQIAGFYDDETKEMVVIQGDNFGGPERMTYTHEFTHLLQDQNYGFKDGLNFSEELLETDMDAYLAMQSLIEGDAVMTEYLWYQMFATDVDQMDVQQFSLEMVTPIYDNAPWFIRNELLFPYQYGLEFIHTLYLEKGWAGVEALYDMPPVSTEQIMHPERYPDDMPVAVGLSELEKVLPNNWNKIADTTFGEAYLYLLLMNGEDEESANLAGIWEAVKGWGGDHYQLYMDQENGDIVFTLKTVWDTEQDALEFADAFETYAEIRWPDGDAQDGYHAEDFNFANVNFYQRGEQTYWIFAPDKEITNSIIEALNINGE